MSMTIHLSVPLAEKIMRGRSRVLFACFSASSGAAVYGFVYIVGHGWPIYLVSHSVVHASFHSVSS